MVVGVFMGNIISIGQLRQNPAPMLRQVRRGAAFTVTDRGEPVADIVPHRDQDWKPLAEVAAILAAIDPDPAWVNELAKQRPVADLTNPWDDAR